LEDMLLAVFVEILMGEYLHQVRNQRKTDIGIVVFLPRFILGPDRGAIRAPPLG